MSANSMMEQDMVEQHSRRYRSSSISPLLALLALLPYGSPGPTYGQQPSQTSSSQANEKPSGQEFAPRGERVAREIKYSDWRKFCFKTPGTNMVCRTTISGTFETGQSAVRIDLIEREGEGAARLQFFLPVGLYLQAGVKITIDQGTPYLVPYVWCLTNTCIAADRVDPKLIGEMKSGQKLLLEVVDSSVLAVSTSVPLNQFAAVRQAPPTQVFEQAIDE
jgi:invasion protein IalB